MFDGSYSSEMARGAARQSALGAPGHGESANKVVAAEMVGQWCSSRRTIMRRWDVGARACGDGVRQGRGLTVKDGGGKRNSTAVGGRRWHERGERNGRLKEGGRL